MDQAGPEAGRSMRSLAWVVAGVLAVGVVAAGVRVADGDRPGRAVVSASGDRSGIDVTSTVTVTLPVEPATPPTTAVTTTTLPKAAVDVLNAIAGSTTSTRRPAPTTTTRPPATTTTTAPAPTTAPTTPTTAAPAPFTATLVNEHPQPVLLIVNGRNIPLAVAQTLEVQLPISQRGDLVQVRLADDEKCGVSDSGVIFKPGARYKVSIVVGPTQCKDVAVPLIKIVQV